MKYTIRQNINHNKFEAVDDNNILLGVVNYEIEDNKRLAITHTIVEPEAEGQGIAGALNKNALLFAKEAGYKVIPVCSYTKQYIIRHPEFSSLEED